MKRQIKDRLAQIAASRAGTAVKVGLVAVSTLAAQAHAALPAEATAAFTQVSGNATDSISAAWPILALVTAAGAGMTLFKKFVGKAV